MVWLRTSYGAYHLARRVLPLKVISQSRSNSRMRLSEYLLPVLYQDKRQHHRIATGDDVQQHIDEAHL